MGSPGFGTVKAGGIYEGRWQLPKKKVMIRRRGQKSAGTTTCDRGDDGQPLTVENGSDLTEHRARSELRWAQEDNKSRIYHKRVQHRSRDRWASPRF